MIPLEFLWKWLWIHYKPLENGEEQPILKEDVVKELLATPEASKSTTPVSSGFANALISRFLCILFEDSPKCKQRFTDTEDPNRYTLMKVTEEESEERKNNVPEFAGDLRMKILQELKEERQGRSSVQNLLRLGQQSEGEGRTISGKRAASEMNNAQQTKQPTPTKRAREYAASSGTPNAQPPYSQLRKVVSSPVLPGMKNVGTSLFVQQEPWKREVNELWAKQLAMMREINTLKVELTRREAARQREILAMRQELDVMRAEVFRLRQTVTTKPLGKDVVTPGNSSQNNSQEVGGVLDQK